MVKCGVADHAVWMVLLKRGRPSSPVDSCAAHCCWLFRTGSDCRFLAGYRYIQEHLPEEIRRQCHFFNSFFFKKLTEKGGRKSGDSNASGGASDGRDSAYKRGFERVRKWTRVSRLCSIM